MKPEYYDALINGVMKNNFPPVPVDYGYRDSTNFWYTQFCAGLKSPLRSRSRHPRKRILNPSAMLPTAAMTAYNSPMTR